MLNKVQRPRGMQSTRLQSTLITRAAHLIRIIFSSCSAALTVVLFASSRTPLCIAHKDQQQHPWSFLDELDLGSHLWDDPIDSKELTEPLSFNPETYMSSVNISKDLAAIT